MKIGMCIPFYRKSIDQFSFCLESISKAWLSSNTDSVLHINIQVDEPSNAHMTAFERLGKKYFSKIPSVVLRFSYNAQNKGLLFNRIKGFENLPECDWYCTVDADDCITPDYFETMFNTVRTSDDFDIVGFELYGTKSGMDGFIDKKEETSDFAEWLLPRHRAHGIVLKWLSQTAMHSLLISIKHVEPFHLNLGEDLIICSVLSIHGFVIKYIPYILYYYDDSDGNTNITNEDIEQRVESKLRFIDKFFRLNHIFRFPESVILRALAQLNEVAYLLEKNPYGGYPSNAYSYWIGIHHKGRILSPQDELSGKTLEAVSGMDINQELVRKGLYPRYSRESNDLRFFVCIPFYKKSEEIFTRCVESIAKSYYKYNITVICGIDEQETNIDMVKKVFYDNGIYTADVFQRSNQGCMRNRMLMWNHVRDILHDSQSDNDFILNLDADDALTEDCFDVLTDNIKSNNQALVYLYGIRDNYPDFVEAGIHPVYDSSDELKENYFQYEKAFLSGNDNSVCDKCYRANLVTEQLYFLLNDFLINNQHPKINYMEDLVISTCLSLIDPVTHVIREPSYLNNYYPDSEGLTCIKDANSTIPTRMEVIAMLSKFIVKVSTIAEMKLSPKKMFSYYKRFHQHWCDISVR